MRYPVVIWPFLKVSGLTLYPFIILSKPELKADVVTIRHERIHIRQAEELLVIPFYILYLFNYLINLIIYRNHNKAYMNICFEREAYRFEHDANYLPQRRFWSWIQFVSAS